MPETPDNPETPDIPETPDMSETPRMPVATCPWTGDSADLADASSSPAPF